MQHFPETSIPWMKPAAEVQNFAVLFSFHKFQGFDPLSMNGRAMNQSRQIHRGCTHAQAAQPFFCEFWIVFLLESSDVLKAAGWDQTASHSRHPLCVFFQIQFELSILNILNVNQATHCLNLPPLELKTTWTAASALTLQPTDSLCLCQSELVFICSLKRKPYSFNCNCCLRSDKTEPKVY
jgi:hypothetical protein